MFETFRVRNILAPQRKQLLWGILCWVMYEIGFAMLFAFVFDLETEHGLFWYQIANFCAMFILTVLCFLPFLRESYEETDRKNLMQQVIFGYGIYYVLSLVVSVGVMLLHYVFDESTVNANQDAVTSLLKYNPLVMAVCTAILVPITEECLCRGMIFAPLCKKNPFLAYALSATVFAVIHLIASIGQMNWINAVENFVTYLPSGIVLGWVYQRTGTILGPIVLHCLINLLSVMMIFSM